MSPAPGASNGMRPRRRRRLPLANLTNLSSTSASRLTRLKGAAHSKPTTSTGSSSASTVPRCPPPPPPPPLGAGKAKSTREFQSCNYQLKKIKENSKPAGDMLPGASTPPSKKTRKRTKEEQHRESLDHNSGNSLPSQNFIEKQKAYFAEVDAFELVKEFVSASDIE